MQRAHDKERVACRQLARHTDIRVEGHLKRTRHVIDITALLIGIKHDANSQPIFDDGNVDKPVAADAVIAPLCEGVCAVETSFKLGQVRLVGDIAHGTTHRARTKKRALRPCQNFHALQVGSIDVEIAPDERCGRIVQV